MYRPCLWMHKKELQAAYLGDVNKTKDEIGLISQKYIKPVNFNSNFCTCMSEHFSTVGQINN